MDIIKHDLYKEFATKGPKERPRKLTTFGASIIDKIALRLSPNEAHFNAVELDSGKVKRFITPNNEGAKISFSYLRKYLR